MNVIKSKGRLLAHLMARVDGCAWLVLTDRAASVEAFMVKKRLFCRFYAARCYVIGSLKQSIKRGIARTYAEAIETFEAEQVGDRGDPMTRTINADKTARVIARHKQRTEAEPMVVGTIGVQHQAWARMDGQPFYAYRDRIGHTVSVNRTETKRKHAVSVGRALGTLYAEWETRTVEVGPAHAAEFAIRDRNMRLFFAEYKARLSRTVHGRLAELKKYLKNGMAGDKTPEDIIKALLSAEGRTADSTKKLAKFCVNLWQHFKHKDAITAPEFVELLYTYGLDGKAE